MLLLLNSQQLDICVALLDGWSAVNTEQRGRTGRRKLEFALASGIKTLAINQNGFQSSRNARYRTLTKESISRCAWSTPIGGFILGPRIRTSPPCTRPKQMRQSCHRCTATKRSRGYKSVLLRLTRVRRTTTCRRRRRRQTPSAVGRRRCRQPHQSSPTTPSQRRPSSRTRITDVSCPPQHLPSPVGAA